MQQESHFGVLEVSMSVLGGEQMTNLTLPFRDSLQLMNDIGGKLTATSRTEAMNVSNELFDALERVLASPLVWGSFYCHSKGYVALAADTSADQGLWYVADQALAKWLRAHFSQADDARVVPQLGVERSLNVMLVRILEFLKWRSFHIDSGSHLRSLLIDSIRDWSLFVARGGALAFAALEIAGGLMIGAASDTVLSVLTEAARAAAGNTTMWGACDALLSAASPDASRAFWVCLNALSAFQHLTTPQRLKVTQSSCGPFYSTLGQFAQLTPKYIAVATSQPASEAKELVLRACTLYLDIIVNDPDELFDTDIPHQEVVQVTMDALTWPQPQDVSSSCVADFRSQTSFVTGYEKEYLGRVVLSTELNAPAMAVVVEVASKARTLLGGSCIIFGMLGQGFDEARVMCATQHVAEALQRLVDVVGIVASCAVGENDDQTNRNSAISESLMASAIVDANSAIAIFGALNSFIANDSGSISGGLVLKILTTTPRRIGASPVDSSASLVSLMLMLIEGASAPICISMPVATVCLNFLVLALRHSLREVAPLLLEMGVLRYIVAPTDGSRPSVSSSQQEALFVAVACACLSALSEHPDTYLYIVADPSEAFSMYFYALKLCARGSYFGSAFVGDDYITHAIRDQFKITPATFDMFRKEFGGIALSILSAVANELQPEKSRAAAIGSPLVAHGLGDEGASGDCVSPTFSNPVHTQVGSSEARGGDEDDHGPGDDTMPPPLDKSHVQRQLNRLACIARAGMALFSRGEGHENDMTEATHPGITTAIYSATLGLLNNNLTLGPSYLRPLPLPALVSFIFLRNTGSSCPCSKAFLSSTFPGLAAIGDFLIDVILPVLQKKPVQAALYRKKTGLTSAAVILHHELAKGTDSSRQIAQQLESSEGKRIVDCLVRAFVFVNTLAVQRSSRAGKHVPSPQHEASLLSSLHELFSVEPLRSQFAIAVSEMCLKFIQFIKNDLQTISAGNDMTAANHLILLVSSPPRVASDLQAQLFEAIAAMPASKMSALLRVHPSMHFLVWFAAIRLGTHPDQRVVRKLVQEWLPAACGEVPRSEGSDDWLPETVKGLFVLMLTMQAVESSWRHRAAAAAQPPASQVRELPDSDVGEDGVMCPMCFKNFSIQLIQGHAASCQGEQVPSLADAAPSAKSNRNVTKKKKLRKKKGTGSMFGKDDNDDDDDDETNAIEVPPPHEDLFAVLEQSVLGVGSPPCDAFLRLTNIEVNLQHFRSWFLARRFVSSLLDGGNAVVAAAWISKQTSVIVSQVLDEGRPDRCANLMYLFGSRGVARVLAFAPVYRNVIIHACLHAVQLCVRNVVDGNFGTIDAEKPDEKNALKNCERNIAAATLSAALSCLNCLYLESRLYDQHTALLRAPELVEEDPGFPLELLLAFALVFDVPQAESATARQALLNGPCPSYQAASVIAAALASMTLELLPSAPSGNPLNCKRSIELAQQCTSLLTIPVADIGQSVALRVSVNQAHVLLRICLDTVKLHGASEGVEYEAIQRVVSVEQILAVQGTIISFDGELEASATVLLLTAQF